MIAAATAPIRSAIMVVYMSIHDTTWITSYYEEVPRLLAEYGAVSLAGARGGIISAEGDLAPPDRIAIFAFPSLDAIDCFLADERYQVYRALRQAGTASEIFVFENAVTGGELV